MSDAVIIALIGLIVTIGSSIITAYVAIRVAKIGKKQDVIHKQINGQQETLLELARTSGRAEGNLEGRKEILSEGLPLQDEHAIQIGRLVSDSESEKKLRLERNRAIDRRIKNLEDEIAAIQKSKEE